MPHDGISPVCKCKKHVLKNIFHNGNEAEHFFLKSYMYAFTYCSLRVGKFDVSASNMIIFWRQYYTKLRLMDSGNA